MSVMLDYTYSPYDRQTEKAFLVRFKFCVPFFCFKKRVQNSQNGKFLQKNNSNSDQTLQSILEGI